MVSADPQVQGSLRGSRPVGVVFFACQLRNQFVGTAAGPVAAYIDRCALFKQLG